MINKKALNFSFVIYLFSTLFKILLYDILKKLIVLLYPSIRNKLLTDFFSAELVRLLNVFRQVPNLHWIIVEDSRQLIIISSMAGNLPIFCADSNFRSKRIGLTFRFRILGFLRNPNYSNILKVSYK